MGGHVVTGLLYVRYVYTVVRINITAICHLTNTAHVHQIDIGVC